MPKSEYDTVRLMDVDLRVARGGAGAPLMFLHDAWLGGAWLPFHDRLAERFRVIVPEHPGYGGGDAPPWLDRVDDLANFYLDFVAAQELRGVHLVGASLGGWIAAELAIRSTARLASLTLIDPWGLLVAGGGGIDPFVTNDEQSVRDLFHDQKIADDVMTRVLAPENEDALLKGKMVTAKLAWQPRLHDPHLCKWLHRIDVPTLIAWGEADPILPATAYGPAWQNAIPGARLATVPKVGHLPHREQPQVLAGSIMDFIAQQQRAAT